MSRGRKFLGRVLYRDPWEERGRLYLRACTGADFSKFDIYNWISCFVQEITSQLDYEQIKKFHLSFQSITSLFKLYSCSSILFVIQFSLSLSKFSKIILFSIFESKDWIFLQSIKKKKVFASKKKFVQLF